MRSSLIFYRYQLSDIRYQKTVDSEQSSDISDPESLLPIGSPVAQTAENNSFHPFPGVRFQRSSWYL